MGFRYDYLIFYRQKLIKDLYNHEIVAYPIRSKIHPVRKT